MEIRFNAWGHEIAEGTKAISHRRGDTLEVIKARKSHICNDCKSKIEKGDIHGTPNVPFISRHVCLDCLRNLEAMQFQQTQNWKVA